MAIDAQGNIVAAGTAEYDRYGRAARERAQAWHPDRLAPLYREFFGSIVHQPDPPCVPREVARQLVAEARFD